MPTTKIVRVTAMPRPYVLTFLASGHSYPMTSGEVDLLLAEYPVVSATAYRVVLPGHNTPDPKQRSVLQPTTRGGGPAFIIEHE